jgi:hypothetical protein
MNEHITERSLEADALAEYVKKAEVLSHLYRRSGELEETIEAMDRDIDETAERGLDEIADQMCRTRNALERERLDLEIQLHKLEIELAEFEKIRLSTN